jgi:hypothetical protein
LVETDKAWDAIHRVLGDGSLKCGGSSSLERVILGGKQLHAGEDYMVSYLSAAEVMKLAEELAPLTQAWFRERYFGLGKKRFGLLPASDYDGPINEEDFEYSWSYFEDIRDFFARAATEGRAVVFTMSQ